MSSLPPTLPCPVSRSHLVTINVGTADDDKVDFFYIAATDNPTPAVAPAATTCSGEFEVVGGSVAGEAPASATCPAGTYAGADAGCTPWYVQCSKKLSGLRLLSSDGGRSTPGRNCLPAPAGHASRPCMGANCCCPVPQGLGPCS